jgi:alkanesulfonate monooxygenase SsuD/methylene tetrahydromethanopterin reductase-like flavin-dependent oxidoreductase (luciferase family)
MIERLRGKLGPLRRPVRSLEAVSTPEERTALERFLPLAVVGARQKVYDKLDTLIAETAADELIVLTLIHDQAARHRSFEILAEHGAFALGG